MPQHRRPQELRAGHILAAALGTYRRRPGRVAGTALIVFAPVAIADAFVTGAADNLQETQGDTLWMAALGVVLAALSAQVLMIEFYAGLLDRVVGEDQHGHRAYSFGQVVRTLPWWRLAAASALIGAVTNIGLSLFILPGLVAFTYLSLAGPMINIERHGIGDGVRRSVSLVRGHFWLTFLCVTLPLIVESLLYEAMHRFVWTHSFVGLVVMEEVLAVTVVAFVGLSEVTLAHALIVADAQGDDGGTPNPSS